VCRVLARDEDMGLKLRVFGKKVIKDGRLEAIAAKV
jgi:hypothetical protein